MALLSNKYKKLYSGYYQPTNGSSLEHKRNLSAESTIDHIQAVSSDGRWKSLLDVGAGNGAVLARAEKENLAADLYAIEIAESGVRAISELGLSRLRDARLFDGYSIPYPDKFFDAAVCIHVLEHVEHERILLREIARVANEIVIEVPLEGGFIIEKSIRQGAKFGHINHYTVPGFLFLLQTAGLSPIKHVVTTSSAAYERHLYGGVRGTIKSAIRRGALKIAPNIAPWLMTYLLTVRCLAQS
jgi:ubiquinone/menaquinone biosynthesis C-methylase UbiE